MKSAGVAFAFLLLSASAATAQQYVISTVAGGAPPAMPVRGVDLPINTRGLATDAAGNVYFTSTLDCVFKLDTNGFVTLAAGNSRPGYSGDGGPAASAQLNSPLSMAVDRAGNLFIADAGNHRVRKVSPRGIITTVAGNGTQGFSGDGGPSTSAQLNSPRGLAVDSGGNLFIADVDNHRVRRVSPDGIIATVAGNGSVGFSGDGGPATSSTLFPRGVAVDGVGNLFIVDSPSRVRKVSPDGIITTVAGNGTNGFSGDGGPAAGALLLNPVGVAVDAAGNLFIADSGRVRKVSSNGIITSVSTGDVNYSFYPSGVAVDGAGNLFVADNWNRIFKVSPDGSIATVAGSEKTWAFTNIPYALSGGAGNGGPATGAQLVWPTGVAVDRAGNLFIADPGRVRKVFSPDGIITTVAGDGAPGFSGDGGPAPSAHIGGQLGPFSVAADDTGNLFLAETVMEFGGFQSGYRVRKVSPSGIITTVAGNGTQGFSGDGGPSTSAQLSGPAGVVADGAGNLFIADTGNSRIRKVSKDGIITTVAGNGTYGTYSGDGGPATSAQVSAPLSLAVDGTGNLFIGSSWGGWEGSFGTGLIRKVSASGIVTTVAGNGGNWGFSGDGGPATSAQLTAPIGVAVDGAGNLFIADVENNRIRKVSLDGIITTVAGNGIPGFSGDGGFATSAQLNQPEGVAVDRAGNVYVADTGNHAVRVLRPTNRSVLISAVVDAASQRVNPISPGKIVVIYGAGLGPAQLVQNQPGDGQFGSTVGGTVVSFNGIAAPVLYASATQVAAVVPYAISGTAAQVTVTYQGQASAAFAVPVALSAPSLFTSNQTGAGQAAAVNADGVVNTAAHPVKVGGFLSLYATGGGQTSPGGVDGKLGGSAPVLPVKVTIGGIPATVQFVGGTQGLVAGLMQVNVQIPTGVQPGGYVPVVLQVGDISTTPGAVWIAVAGN